VNQLLRRDAWTAACVTLGTGLALLQLTAAVAADPPAKGSDSTQTAPHVGAKAVTLEEGTKWGAALERAVRVQDVDTFNMLVDWDAFAERAAAIPGDSPQLKALRVNFAHGLKAAVASPRSGFGRAISAAVETSGDYKALRAHSEGSEVRVLFRLVSNNGALNYHDWVLAHSSQGKTVAIDCHVFLMGELYTQNVRRSFLPLARKTGASVEKLSPAEKDFLEHFNQFAQMGNAIHQRDWPQALKIYKSLPASVQESKPAMTMRLLATQATSNAEYLATMDEFRKRYPKDPMIDLISVDAHILRKAYDKALESIDRVDKIIGGDPYLKVLRANVLLQENKLDAANKMAQDAIAEDPKMVRGYYSLIDISLARHDFADTVKWLKKAESTGVRFGDLAKVSSFKEFVKSPEYTDWAKTHTKETPAKPTKK
jgi:hypothetical protein